MYSFFKILETRIVGMELLKLLLSINLIFITVKTATGNNSSANVENIYKQSIKPIRYYIDLTLFTNEDDYKNTNIYKTFKSYIDEQLAKGNFIFYGEFVMFFEIIKTINKIQLHVRNLKIDEAATRVVFNLGGIQVNQIPEFYIDKETIVLDFDHYFLPEIHTYHLIMKFVGSITDNTEGFFKLSYINDKGEKKWLIAAADFRGPGARQIFPCWDEPDIRTNFTISIKHHQNYTAVSNTPITYNYTDNSNMVRTYFETTDKISPYHIAVVLSDLNYYSDMWCRHYVEQQISFAQIFAKNVTLCLKDMFDNIRFPLTIRYIAIPDFRDEGVESWGLVIYRETAIIYDEKLDVISWKFQVAHTIARKIVHQYFGNLISQSSWSYLWLNEGIATFLAMKILNQLVHPHLMDLLAVQYQHESLRLNDYYNMPLVNEVDTSDINSLFSFTYYIKGPVFIRSLLQAIPTDVFEIGLNKYLTMYQLRSIDTSNSTIDNFLNILQDVLDTNIPESDINLTERFIFWTEQERYPVLQVTRKSSGNKIEIHLTERYPRKLWICVTYTTQENPNITETRWLTPHKSILYLDHINKNHWIIVNVKQAGYYRVNYDNDNWQKLVKYLNSTKYFNIHVLNRAQIIDDAYYFLSTNKLDFNLFKTLTYYLSKDTDYVAWYPMFKILEHISGFFPFSQSTEVKEHFRKILDLVLTDIGFLDLVKEDKFTKCLRQEIAEWACILNSRKCTSAATYDLITFYDMQKPILPGWKEWMYCKGLMLANKTWHTVLNTEKLSNKLLEFLACSKNHTIIISYIDRLKSGYFTEVQHRIAVFHSVIARHAKNDLVLDYILKNFANIVPSKINTIVALVDIINHLYSEDQLDKIRVFVAKFSSKISLYADEKIEIRSYQLDRHIGYFKSFLQTKQIDV